MRVEQAVESGVPALVAQFEPPDELIRNQPAGKVEIAVQSLLNEPLNGRISVEVKGGSRSMMCMLPGDDDDDDGAEEPGGDPGLSDAGALDASRSGAEALDAGAGEDGEESPE
jgi:hypothetical protein